MWNALALLVLANVFMTLAWYGHLRYPQLPISLAIVGSWGIALIEYLFQVPANRLGYGAGMTAAQLKAAQEVITLVVFTGFAWFYLGEAPRWNTILGFVLILLGAICVFAPWRTGRAM